MILISYQYVRLKYMNPARKVYQVRQKSNPLKLFAVFSATTENFSVKFYTCMWLSYLYLNVKRNLIIFKYDEVIDILAWPPSDIFARSKTFA